MITLFFKFGGEKIIVVIEGTNVQFGNTAFGAVMAPIDGLQLSRKGVIKEFPDLETNTDWRGEAIRRLKDKYKQCGSEKGIADYIIKDLTKFGYTPELIQKKGFRAEAIR